MLLLAPASTCLLMCYCRLLPIPTCTCMCPSASHATACAHLHHVPLSATARPCYRLCPPATARPCYCLLQVRGRNFKGIYDLWAEKGLVLKGGKGPKARGPAGALRALKDPALDTHTHTHTHTHTLTLLPYPQPCP